MRIRWRVACRGGAHSLWDVRACELHHPYSVNESRIVVGAAGYSLSGSTPPREMETQLKPHNNNLVQEAGLGAVFVCVGSINIKE